MKSTVLSLKSSAIFLELNDDWEKDAGGSSYLMERKR